MKIPVIFSLLCLFASSHSLLKAEEIPLFNGKDLTGWKVPADNIWYLVEDGVLQLRNGPDQKGSILWTEDEFEDFSMTFDFKFISGTIDSGIHLRNEDQIQIGISGSLKRDMTGSPYIKKVGYPVEAEGVAELLKQDDWNTMNIEARGMDYKVSLNGQEVMTYTSTTGQAKGPIGIQLHAKREMGIDYRNIRVVKLD